MSKIRNISSILLAAILVPMGAALAVAYFALWNFSDYLSLVKLHLGDPDADLVLLYTAIGIGVTAMLSLLAYLLTLDVHRKKRPLTLIYICFWGLSLQAAALVAAGIENTISYAVAIPASVIISFGAPLLIFPLEASLRWASLWFGLKALGANWNRLAAFCLHKALLFKPANRTITEYYGQALDGAGKVNAARYALLPLVETGDVSEVTLKCLALGYEKEHNLPRAIRFYEKLHTPRPDDESILKKLIDLYLATEQIEKAIPLVESRTDFNSLQDLLYLEHLYADIGNIKRVRELLSKAAELEGTPCVQSLLQYRRILKQHPDETALIREMGELCWKLDKKAEGCEYFESLLEKEPDNRSFRRKLLDYYLETSQPAKMEKHLEFLITHGESSPLILREYAEVLIQKEDLDGALDYLKKAKELYPNDYEFPNILAQLYYDNKDYDRAREEMATALRIVPPEKKDNLQILYRKIDGAILNAQLKDIRTKIESDPKNVPLRLELIDKLTANAYLERVTSEVDTLLYFHPELKQIVIAHLEDLTKKYERNYLLLDYLADMNIRGRNYDKCMELYEQMASQSLHPRQVIITSCEKLLKIAPEFVPARKKLGDLAREDKDWQTMIHQYLLCMDEDEDSIADCYEDLFGAFYKTGSLEDAEKFGLRFIEKEPHNTAFHTRMGNLYLELERYEDAIKFFKKARSLDPRDPQNYDLVEQATRLLKKQQIENLKRHIEAEPDNTRYRERLGDLLCFFEDYTEAVKHYQKAAQLAPQADICKAKLAFCLAKKEMFDLAEETLDEVKLSFGESSNQDALKQYFYETAAVFETELLPEKAIKYYKQIFRVDAAFRDIVKKIEKLDKLGTTISPYGKRIRRKH